MAAATISAPLAVKIAQAPKPIYQFPPQPPLRPEAYFKAPFNPAQHLAFRSMPEVHTMAELGLADRGVSRVGISEPFELFTPEAVQHMRNEVLSDDVWDNCRFASSINACQLRGMAPKFAKFVYDAWTNPETLKIVSSIAGLDLVPVMDYEIGHINISVTDEALGTTKAAPVVGWHCDSYPFVCVVMLSDATEMIGGETALRKGDGEIMKVRGPQMGSAVVLQGRYIEHMALPSTNTKERITMVTSFRPKSAFLPDDSVLITVRCCSDLQEMYNQWTEYRLEMVEERCRSLVKMFQAMKRVGRPFDVKGARKNISDLITVLEATRKEIVDEQESSKEEDGGASRKRTRSG